MAGELFVKIADITPDSQDVDHKEEYFDVESFSFGGSQNWDSAGGYSKGRTRYEPFTFAIRHDRSVAMLYQFMNNNEAREVTVHWRMKTKGGNILGVDMTLEEGRIIGVNTAIQDTADGVEPMTVVTMGYQKMVLKTDSEFGDEIEVEWNTQENV